MSGSVKHNLEGLEENIISKPIYMSKNIKYNINHLKFISKNARGEDVKQKINTIIEYLTIFFLKNKKATNSMVAGLFNFILDQDLTSYLMNPDPKIFKFFLSNVLISINFFFLSVIR